MFAAALSRRAGAFAPLARAGALAPRRAMSGHGSAEEIAMSKEMWVKVTFGMIVFLVAPYTAFTVYKEAVHEHSTYVQYPHMKVRHKSFPWAASDCDFLDLECHRLAAKGVADPFNAAKHHGHGGAAHAAHH